MTTATTTTPSLHVALSPHIGVERDMNAGWGCGGPR
jgi:hypothetical protein